MERRPGAQSDEAARQPWRAARGSLERSLAWGNALASLAAFAGAFLLLHPMLGPGAAALYAVPCAFAGWGFGVAGGVALALLWLPVRAALLALAPGAPPVGLMDMAPAITVGLSLGLMRERYEGLRLARLHPATTPA